MLCDDLDVKTYVDNDLSSTYGLRTLCIIPSRKRLSFAWSEVLPFKGAGRVH